MAPSPALCEGTTASPSVNPPQRWTHAKGLHALRQKKTSTPRRSVIDRKLVPERPLRRSPACARAAAHRSQRGTRHGNRVRATTPQTLCSLPYVLPSKQARNDHRMIATEEAVTWVRPWCAKEQEPCKVWWIRTVLRLTRAPLPRWRNSQGQKVWQWPMARRGKPGLWSTLPTVPPLRPHMASKAMQTLAAAEPPVSDFPI